MCSSCQTFFFFGSYTSKCVLCKIFFVLNVKRLLNIEFIFKNYLNISYIFYFLVCFRNESTDLRDVIINSKTGGVALDQEKVDQYIKAMSLTGSEKVNGIFFIP